MDPKLIRDWKRGQEAANQVILEEARNRTPSERFALLEAFLVRLASMNRLTPRSDDLDFHLRWQLAREAWLAKQSRA
ncbi:MAG: hypothetical protein IT363_16080 [Methanoregulaceae archaeon]|nr:hypothetical protein [Methanoregulaceae archaeon]